MNSDGIGLGLTIVKQIADSANGKVSVHSDGEGKGCKFTVNLPMRAFI